MRRSIIILRFCFQKSYILAVQIVVSMKRSKKVVGKNVQRKNVYIWLLAAIVVVLLLFFLYTVPFGRVTSLYFCSDGSIPGDCSKTNPKLMCVGGELKEAPGCMGAPKPGPGICGDRAMNLGETDIDCGGPYCPKCGPGKHCMQDSDCTSDICRRVRCI